MDMVSEETEQQSEVYITEEEKHDCYFYPVDTIWQRTKLSTLGGQAVIKLEHKSSRSVPLTQSVLRLRMKGDGNCFFRSINYVITGSQAYHKVARDRVVDYMKTNENAITQFGERYLAESRIPDEVSGQQKLKSWHQQRGCKLIYICSVFSCRLPCLAELCCASARKRGQRGSLYLHC